MAPKPLLLAAAASSIWATAQAQAILELMLSGACDRESFLNGQVFQQAGRTASGAPWFKAKSAPYWMYYDPDCGRGNDGTPRWIIDANAPSTTAVNDLDGDGICEYYARVNSDDSSGPPLAATWSLQCTGPDGWAPSFVVLLNTAMGSSGQVGSPDTSGATRTTTATSYRNCSSTTSTLRSPAPGVTTASPGDALCSTCSSRGFVLTGACSFRGQLNGQVFQLQGYTLDGAPFFKVNGFEVYMYYDADCDGVTSAGTPGRWVLDKDRPSMTRSVDLDNDGQCNYDARVDTTVNAAPPVNATWKMYCGDVAGWQSVVLTLQPAPPVSNTTLIYVSGAPAHRRLPVALAALLVLAALLARGE